MVRVAIWTLSMETVELNPAFARLCPFYHCGCVADASGNSRLSGKVQRGGAVKKEEHVAHHVVLSYFRGIHDDILTHIRTR